MSQQGLACVSPPNLCVGAYSSEHAACAQGLANITDASPRFITGPHTHTLSSMLCPWQGFGVRHTINPNPYTGAHGNDGAAYAQDVAEVIRTCTPGRVAGFVAETVQGVGGSVPLADGYLPAVYQARSDKPLKP